MSEVHQLATGRARRRRLALDLFGEIPRSWSNLGFALLLSVLSSIAAVGLMGTAGWLIARAAEQPPVMYLTVATVIVRACGLSRGGFRYVERLVSHDLALRMQGALRLHVYDRLSRTTLLGRRRGDLMVRIVSDVEAIMDLVVRVLLPFASAAIVVLATTIVLGTFSWPIALGVLITAILAGVAVPFFARAASRAADRELVPARGELASLTAEINEAAADLAAYGDTTRTERFAAVDARLRRAEEKVSVVRGFAVAAQVVAAGLAVLWSLSIGLPAVAAGSLTRVELAVVVLTPLALHEVLTMLVVSAQTSTRVAAALDRVAQVLDAPPLGRGDAVAHENADDPGMRVVDASIGWGETPVRTGLDLRVDPGEWVALTGPSGCGKTTLAATLMGLIPPISGVAEVRGSVGYLAQDAHVFNTSVRENVRIGDRDADDTAVLTALARAGFPTSSGICDRIVGEEGSMLSGGEARRLAIARLLVAGHQCWILDEPTEHLDAETASALLSDLREITADAPTLVITHDPAVMAVADRTVTLA